MPEVEVLDVIEPVVPPQSVLPVNTSAVGGVHTGGRAVHPLLLPVPVPLLVHDIKSPSEAESRLLLYDTIPEVQLLALFTNCKYRVPLGLFAKFPPVAQVLPEPVRLIYTTYRLLPLHKLPKPHFGLFARNRLARNRPVGRDGRTDSLKLGKRGFQVVVPLTWLRQSGCYPLQDPGY